MATSEWCLSEHVNYVDFSHIGAERGHVTHPADDNSRRDIDKGWVDTYAPGFASLEP